MVAGLEKGTRGSTAVQVRTVSEQARFCSACWINQFRETVVGEFEIRFAKITLAMEFALNRPL